MVFPASMSHLEKREKMAIMETAISASLSHPNIVQMYTYYLRPVLTDLPQGATIRDMARYSLFGLLNILYYGALLTPSPGLIASDTPVTVAATP